MSQQTVFNGRYELHRRLARGGMAEVFLARDQLLDRPVAVKVLFPEYASDPNFVARFRREAQSAANLNHPNIVGVYDWGEQDNTYFIVMEYLDGRSLADIIRAEAPLHPDRVADIAIDIAAALGFAHRNGVVHRDIKPGNVLISPSGQVKVADFGIARALDTADDNLTQTGAVMGTAAYFAPEQAQGQPLDPRSDLYSLGAVMYEMLTARPPFTGDSPVAVAYKHVQEQPTPPLSINPDVPPPLESIVLKLLAKAPAERYPSAEDLRADLRRYRRGEPLLLASGAAVAATAAATQAVPTYDGTAVLPVEEEVDDYRPPRRTGWYIVLLVLLLAALGGLIWLLARALGVGDPDDSVPQVAVPEVIGLPVDEAVALLDEQGFEVDRLDVENAEFAPGIVFDQSPAQGTLIEEGSTVDIRVAQEVTIQMPEVTDSTFEEANAFLAGQNFTDIRRIDEFNDDAAPGIVFRQDPAAGEEVALDSPVFLTVSRGPEPIPVPDVTGDTADSAANTLGQAGFPTTTRLEASDSVEAGRVIRTEPPANTPLVPGQTVVLVVSSGPAPVTVPPVVGLSQEAATSALTQAGFEVEVVEQEIDPAEFPGVEDGEVIDQNPDGNTQAPPGSTVTITVARLPADGGG